MEVVQDPGTARTGKAFVLIEDTSILQLTKVDAGYQYRYEGWIRGKGMARIWFHQYVRNKKALQKHPKSVGGSKTQLSEEWRRYSVTYTPSDPRVNEAGLAISIRGNAFVDDASFARVGELEQARDALNKFIAQRQKMLKSSGVSANTTAELLGNIKDNFRTEANWRHLLDGLHMAGLTE